MNILNKKNREFLLLALVAVLAILFFKSCSNARAAEAEMKRNQDIHDQNLRALNDTITLVRNKAGDLVAEKSSFVSTIEDLEKANKDLYDETQKEIGRLNSIIKSNVTASTGGFVVSNELKRYPDGNTYGLLFEKSSVDSTLKWTVEGESRFKLTGQNLEAGETEIFKNEMNLSIVLGFKKQDNGDYKVFARSASPNVTFDSLSGVLIIPKPDEVDPIFTPGITKEKNKKFGVGVQLGYGALFDFKNQRLSSGPYFGLGISYNIIKF